MSDAQAPLGATEAPAGSTEATPGDTAATPGGTEATAGAEQAPEQVDGYCVKCKTSRTMQDVEMVRTKNGRLMAKGKCPVCGTTMTKFMKG
jgi:hypothetical protein